MHSINILNEKKENSNEDRKNYPLINHINDSIF